MTLAPGSCLGPYKIVTPLGAGGMGEVYRAHDSRLGRDVAIKVLPQHLAATPEVRARFEREARTISQLNHPHICTLFDVGHQDGTDFLVMELLEGETLAHRLERGPLPVAEVLTLGAQIADALDRAHRAGVVHRDLKPGNVMLTKAGAKLMDFGLARVAGPGGAAGGSALTAAPGPPDESPTVQQPLTAEGTIVGTFQYMAPEQLEGREADARTDIRALGCVLYEMATGKRAFEGASQASLISAIMKDEPRPITELQPLSPPALDRVVRQCLAKDPNERWQSAGDLGRELRWLAEGGSQAGVPAPVAAQRRRRERLPWVVATGVMVVAIVALAVVVASLWTHRQPAFGIARLSITGPEGAVIEAGGPSVAISPDGQRLVFVAADSAGTSQLWLRLLNSSSAQPIAGTQGALFPFWSPDSRFIAFFDEREQKLKKVPAAGGPPETICDAPSGRGGSWSKDGVIVFAPLPTGPLQRVSSEGGEVATIVRPDSARGETALRFPCFLPGGRHFLYVSLPPRQGQFEVYVGDVDSRETKRVMTAGSGVVYADPGYLLFARDGRLVAQRFDGSRLRLTGRAVPLGDAPSSLGTMGAPVLCPPARNVLVKVTEGIPSNTKLVWLDRSGQQTGAISLPPGNYQSPALSPDGRRAAVVKLGTADRGDLWVVDLERAVASPLTFDGSVIPGGALWSPDGSRIAFYCRARGPYEIYLISANGMGDSEPLLQPSVLFRWPLDWSPDGRYLVYGQQSETTRGDLWLVPLTGERKPVPYLQSPFHEGVAAISPDGCWLAYTSDETGRSEVYVRSFPVPGEKYQVSTSGGMGAGWSGDGRELLLATSGGLLSVEVQTTPTFKVGAAHLLPIPSREDIVGLAATRDLSRFLAVVTVTAAAPPSITVILNWEEALREASR